RAKRFSMSITHQRIIQLKSGKKLDMGRGRVRVKSLEDLALDTRGSASGSGTRQRTRMSHAEREVGAACALLLVQRRSRDNRPVGRTAGAAGLSKNSAKKGAKKSAVKKEKPKK